MTRLIRRIGLFALAALLFAPAALAQGNQPQQPAPDVEVSDDELETVADVYLAIEALQIEYRPKVQQAENQEAAKQIQMEFQKKVSQKIQAEEDITPQRFGTIMRAAQADQELGKRLKAAVKTARQDSMNNGGNSNG